MERGGRGKKKKREAWDLVAAWWESEGAREEEREKERESGGESSE